MYSRLSILQTMQHRFLMLLLSLSNLYSIILLGYLFLWAAFGEGAWPLSLMSNFIHLLLLPAFPLFLLALYLRRYWSLLLSGVLVAAFMYLFGPLFLPQMPVACTPSAHECTMLRMITYNTCGNSVNPDDLLALIQDTGADIVALQENTVEQRIALERELGESHPYQVLYEFDLVSSIGLVSRYPVLDHKLFYLQYGVLPYLRATLDLDGLPLTVVVAHMPTPALGRQGYHIRANGDSVALAMMIKPDVPTLLLGDFNTTDQSSAYRPLLEAGLYDAFREAGWGFGSTFPAVSRSKWIPGIPVVRIDYIWHTEHFATARAWVGPDLGSDHLPLIADLIWLR